MRYFAAFSQRDDYVVATVRGGKRMSRYGEDWETEEAAIKFHGTVRFLYRGEYYEFNKVLFRKDWNYQGKVIPAGKRGDGFERKDGSKDFQKKPIKYWVKFSNDYDIAKVECMLAESTPEAGRERVTITEAEEVSGLKVFFNHPRGRYYVYKSRFYGQDKWHYGGVPHLAVSPGYSGDDVTKDKIEPHPDGKTLADLFAEDES